MDFGDTLVREVMTPRPDIVAIQADATLAELRTLLAEQQYSRVPVYEDTLDNVLGFIYVKDLIRVTDARPEERVDPTVVASGAFRARDQARRRSAEGVSTSTGADRPSSSMNTAERPAW